MSDLTVIVVNWNGGSQLRECADAILDTDVDLIALTKYVFIVKRYR